MSALRTSRHAGNRLLLSVALAAAALTAAEAETLPFALFGPPDSAAAPRAEEQVYAGGVQAVSRGDLTTADAHFGAVIDSLSAHGLADSELAIRARLARTRVIERQGRYDEATVRLLTLIAELEQQDGRRDVLAGAYLLLELVHETLGQPNQAYEALTRAGELMRAHDLREGVRPAYHVRASSLARGNEGFGDALAHADSAYAAAVALDDPYNLSDALFLRNALSDVPPAEEARNYRLLASMMLATGQPDFAALDYLDYARMLSEQGDLAGALSVADTAMGYLETAELNGAVAPRIGMLVLLDYAGMLEEADRRTEALDHYREALEYAEVAYAEATQASRLNLENVIALTEAKHVRAEQAEAIAAGRSRRRSLSTALAILAGLLGLLGVLAVRLSRARRRVSEEVDRQLVLRAELQHRVKNNLQILIALLETRAEQTSDAAVRTEFEAMAQRIHNLGAIHAMLHSEADHTGADAERYLQHLADHFHAVAKTPPTQAATRADAAADAEVTGIVDIDVDVCDGVALPERHLMAIGIAFNELLTNTLKHAAHPRSETSIEARLRRRGDELSFLYEDRALGTAADAGGPAGVADAESRMAPLSRAASGSPRGKRQARPRARQATTTGTEGEQLRGSSLGGFLIRSMVRQLRGRLEVTETPQGRRTEISFPAP